MQHVLNKYLKPAVILIISSYLLFLYIHPIILFTFYDISNRYLNDLSNAIKNCRGKFRFINTSINGLFVLAAAKILFMFCTKP